MRTRAWRLVILLPLLLCLTAVGQPQPSQLAANSAGVSFLCGDVQVRHGAEGYKPARLNDVLQSGDAIKTGANSRAQLSLGGDRYVRLDQKSQLLLTQLQTDGLTSLKALAGNVWVTIERKLGAQSKFEVVTPGVVAAVRGTVFSCQVSEDGQSDVNCYEGEVAVTADHEELALKPEQCCSQRRGRRLAQMALDMTRQEADDFVVYNRHRDALQHLGNPLVLVSLAEVGRTKPQAAAITSEVLADLLAQRGFVARTVTRDEAQHASFGADGWLRPAAKADYVVVGGIAVTVTPGRPLMPVVASAHVRAHVVTGGDYRPLLAVEASATGTARQQPVAVRAALTKLGAELAAKFGAGIVQEMSADRPAAVRVDVLNTTGPGQMAGLRDALRGLAEAERVTPLPRSQAGTPALLVAGNVTPEQVADYLRRNAGALVDEPVVAGHVVRVRLKATP